MLQDDATDDLRVFAAVLRGGHTVLGLRNRGLHHRSIPQRASGHCRSYLIGPARNC